LGVGWGLVGAFGVVRGPWGFGCGAAEGAVGSGFPAPVVFAPSSPQRRRKEPSRISTPSGRPSPPPFRSVHTPELLSIPKTTHYTRHPHMVYRSHWYPPLFCYVYPPQFYGPEITGISPTLDVEFCGSSRVHFSVTEDCDIARGTITTSDHGSKPPTKFLSWWSLEASGTLRGYLRKALLRKLCLGIPAQFSRPLCMSESLPSSHPQMKNPQMKHQGLGVPPFFCASTYNGWGLVHLAPKIPTQRIHYLLSLPFIFFFNLKSIAG